MLDKLFVSLIFAQSISNNSRIRKTIVGVEKMSIGERMAKLRKDEDLGQKVLADVLNVSVATVSNYENDFHAPDLQTLIKIAKFYDVTVDYLLELSDSRVNSEIMSQKFVNDVTYANVLSKLKALSPINRLHLLSYLDYLVQSKNKG